MKKENKKKCREEQKEANRKAIKILQAELRKALAKGNEDEVAKLTRRIGKLRELI